LESNWYMNKPWTHKVHYGLEKSYHPYNIFYIFSWKHLKWHFFEILKLPIYGFCHFVRSYFVISFTNLEVWTIEKLFFGVFIELLYTSISRNVLAFICTLHISILVWPKSNWKYSSSFHFWEKNCYQYRELVVHSSWCHSKYQNVQCKKNLNFYFKKKKKCYVLCLLIS